jgi:ParB-like chromosome segregation protein Spo0J
MPPIAISTSRQIPLARLRESANPWRGPDPATDDLEESLEHTPLLSPIVVRALPGGRNQWEIIAGHRRYRAAKARGWSHIECRLVACDDETAELLSLEENLRRRGLKREPKALARLLELYRQQDPPRRGRPKKGQVAALTGARRLAAVTGRSPRDIRRLVKIAKASPAVQRLYAAGQINILEAERLATTQRGGRSGGLKLLTIVKPTAQSRALDALRYALGSFRENGTNAATRREALVLLAEIKKALR